MSVPTSSKGAEFPAELLLRLMCHVLVDRIPDGGLPELCETGKELFEFYSLREGRAKPALPAGEAPVVGTVVRTYERTPFTLEHE